MGVRRLTVPRATSLGVGAAAAAILLWVGYVYWPELFVLPYVAALCVMVLCGAFILLATLYDSYRNPRRGVRIRPIRGFDVFVGLLLAAPALWALSPFVPGL